MPGSTINQLVAASALTGAELIPVWQNGTTKQTALTSIPVQLGVYQSSLATSVARTVQSKLSDFVNAADFAGGDLGAKINAADAALGASPGTIWVDDQNATITTQIVLQNAGRVLRFGAGTFTLSISASNGANALKIAANNVHVCGAGQSVTTLKNGTISKDNVILINQGIYPGTTTITSGVEVSDLTIDGNQANITHPADDTYGNGVVGNIVANCEVHNVLVKNCVFQGIIFQGNGAGTTNANKTFDNTVTACGEVGIGFEGGLSDSIIENNVIYSLITVPEVSTGPVGILISALSASGPNNRALNNTLTSIAGGGITVQDGSNFCLVEGNNLRLCGTAAGTFGLVCNVQSASPSHVSFVGNSLDTCGSSTGNSGAMGMLQLDTTTGYYIAEGNRVSNSPGAGFIVSSGKNNSIIGNKFYNSGTAAGSFVDGIRLASAINTTIAGNDIINSAGYGISLLSGSGTYLGASGSNTLLANVSGGVNDLGTNTQPYPKLRSDVIPIGSVALASLGNDTTPVSGTIYWAEVFVEDPRSFTGIGILNGSVATNNKWLLGLYDGGGALLANTATAGVTTVGTHVFQEIPFTAAFAIQTPGRYFLAAQMNGTTDRFSTIAAATFNAVRTASATGAFGTLTALSVPPGFTANVGPITYLY